MVDDDQETLAAEYVLGTLSSEEREHAEALLSFDPGFEAAVRQWERRLGELNVMVEAVEPQSEVWDRIKNQVAPGEAPAIEPEPPPLPSAGVLDFPQNLDSPAVIEALAVDHPAPETAELPAEESASPALMTIAEAATTETAEEIPAEPVEAFEVPPPPIAVDVEPAERRAEIVHLAKRVRRWRRLTLVASAIAALLAIYVAVSQVAPDVIPPQLHPSAARMVAQTVGLPARQQQDRLVAVLEQGPTAPAFLVTVDTQQRTVYVRRISAKPEAGKSYELWLISNRLPAPRSLGVVGGEDFTQRALSGNYDVDTLRSASFAISLEPPGGSPSGKPTGPVLFTGKAVESLPASQPANPARS